MKHNRHRHLLTLFLIAIGLMAATVGVTQAESWPGMEKAIQNWNGPREVTLRSDLEDPLGSSEVQNLLELFLAEGFRPTLAGPGTTVKEGLILDLRDSAGGRVAILSKAGTGQILALDRQAARPLQKPMSDTSPAVDSAMISTESVEPAPLPSPAATLPANLSEHPLELSWEAKQIALAGTASEETPILALLTDDALHLVRAEGGTVVLLDTWSPGLDSGHALRVGAGDIDGDGKREIAAVWAEDVKGIYQGTDSRPHAWIFSVSKGKLAPLSQDLEGFLRVMNDRLLWQRRGTYVPFAGPVLSVDRDGGKFQVGSQPVWPEGRNLYAMTTLPQGTRALFWTDDSHLVLGSIKEQGGKELVADLGTVSHPSVAVPLRETEYRSGLEKEDRINERNVPLPRRILMSKDEQVFTLVRGRSEGLPLVGTPAGQDMVAEIAVVPEGLTLERPFPGVESFILDFTLLPRAGRTDVLLLLNDRPDGSGKSRLLVQSPH